MGYSYTVDLTPEEEDIDLLKKASKAIEGLGIEEKLAIERFLKEVLAPGSRLVIIHAGDFKAYSMYASLMYFMARDVGFYMIEGRDGEKPYIVRFIQVASAPRIDQIDEFADIIEDVAQEGRLITIYLAPEADARVNEPAFQVSLQVLAVRIASSASSFLVVLTMDPPSLMSSCPMMANAAVVYDPVFKPRDKDPVGGSRVSQLPYGLQAVEADKALSDLVLDHDVRKIIETSIVAPARYGEKPSFMLIGIDGVGKSTIARAVARELGMKAVELDISGSFSKWFGESEKNIRSAMTLAERMGALTIVRNIDYALTSRGDSTSPGDDNTIARVKAALMQRLRASRTIVAVTISDPGALPLHMLRSPALGVYKIPVIPPVTDGEVKAILLAAVNERVSRFKLSFRDDGPKIDDVASDLRFYTAREIHNVARIAVNIALSRGEKEVKPQHLSEAARLYSIDMYMRAAELKHINRICRSLPIPMSIAKKFNIIEREIEQIKIVRSF